MFTRAASRLIAGAAVAALGGTAQAQSVVARYVIDSGGGSSTSATHSLSATIGEPCSGFATSATHALAAGFWLGGAAAPCYANCDGSTVVPILNVNDFICFQQKYAASDPYANCDDSTTAPVLNINDFICFQQKFAAGCP